ncbi:MAG: hypothetical protein C0604_01155, partial [Clostridiales bacterium]
ELSDGIVDYFRASFVSPGAYVIPVDFVMVSPEALLFEFDPGIEIGRVALAKDLPDGFEGLAGNEVIYGLSSGTAYRVTEIDDEDETVYYTTSDGTLVDDIEDMEALGQDVTTITGLDNDSEYLVEIPLSLVIDNITESATTLNAFEFELTSTPNDDSGVTVSAFYLFDDEAKLEYENNKDEWIDIPNDAALATWPLPSSSATSNLRIDFGDAEDKTLTVEFRDEENAVLARATCDFSDEE